MTLPSAQARTRINNGSMTSFTPSIQEVITSENESIFWTINITERIRVARQTLHMTAAMASAVPNILVIVTGCLA